MVIIWTFQYNLQKMTVPTYMLQKNIVIVPTTSVAQSSNYIRTTSSLTKTLFNVTETNTPASSIREGITTSNVVKYMYNETPPNNFHV